MKTTVIYASRPKKEQNARLEKASCVGYPLAEDPWEAPGLWSHSEDSEIKKSFGLVHKLALGVDSIDAPA
ncbi:hypothetical protein P5673_016714 [Acropora cervicornis]|uniref:Uncharacterized protein n=1 Tax=Acropora cervicornis TaxID=6130 RepID=A0AAD9QFL8_ACRCE|nr:hypothetical protein P5673_016714 [Acropora cervicornis]